MAEGDHPDKSCRTLADGQLVSSIVPELPPGTPVTVPEPMPNMLSANTE